MQCFSDKSGRKWTLDLTFGAVLRVKAASGGKFDLLDCTKDNLGQTLWSDLGELYEAMWLIVEPQAAQFNIDAAKFGDLIAAECLIEARDAFFREWIDFFRRLQRRELATALEKVAAVHQRATEMAAERIKEATGPAFDAALEAKIDQALKIAFGPLRASLALTREDSPGGNST